MGEKKISPLKRERFLRGITQKDLSFKTNICTSALSNFEAERWSPTVRQMEILAETLQVPVKRIFPSFPKRK